MRISTWSSDVCSSDLAAQRRADDQAGRAVRAAAIIAVVIAAIDARRAGHADRLIAAAIIAVGPVIAAIARVRTVPVIAVDHAAGALVTVMLAAMLPVVAAVAGIMLLAVKIGRANVGTPVTNA